MLKINNISKTFNPGTVNEKQALSGVAERPYCKGRAYDPNRYSVQNTEE